MFLSVCVCMCLCVCAQLGLHSGPTLFNIYFNVMVANWRAGCPQAGARVKSKHGRKFLGDRTAKSQLDEVCVTESQCADDAAMYHT